MINKSVPAGNSAPVLTDDEKFEKRVLALDYPDSLHCNAQANPAPEYRYETN